MARRQRDRGKSEAECGDEGAEGLGSRGLGNCGDPAFKDKGTISLSPLLFSLDPYEVGIV
jgi:hypothetical protein